MAEFDTFSGELLEESKRFLEKARESPDSVAKTAYLHSALLLSCSALEARVNAIAADAAQHRTNLTVHERGLLLEKDVRLEKGEFQMVEGLKMTRLDERIEFVIVRLSGKRLDKSKSWWGELMAAIRLRNALTHPKDVPAVTEKSVTAAIQATIDALNALSKAIYGKPYPAANRRLASKLQF